MDNLKRRLDKIIDRLTSDALLQNKGLGNEIGFYVFDYPPEHEMEVREHIQFILRQLPKINPDLKFNHIHLFELILAYLTSRKLLDRSIAIQKKEGDRKLLASLIKGPLDPKNISKAFMEAADPQHHDLILVSGVGSAYPLLRSHNLLNNLHPLMGSTPLVMFYPGNYTGQGLRLFGKLKEANYYRAFQLVV